MSNQRQRDLDTPISPPCMIVVCMQRASAAASESPRFRPRPASGCMMCTASMSAVLILPMYASACRKRRGKDVTVPSWMLATNGGNSGDRQLKGRRTTHIKSRQPKNTTLILWKQNGSMPQDVKAAGVVQTWCRRRARRCGRCRRCGMESRGRGH
jgi:hypothetical protein